ncbi:dTDP-4-dehydrorhamnose reductase family protein [Pontiella sulfatireligans]|uniref:dTDP-4-dehydrorhamnose reductase n=1 Tax=Pontiella sulfatireligans TaxID=2750658 RepID=A0A6C2UHD8_9BACT|nr:SDR family oxidoreductase [Pontiella sulfatireligans]VGO19349.1 dTDP-4-dehydrorhamnose reductase [Pontiella sulfatireligans]
MRILITGASGLLGRAFVRQFEGDYELYATGFSRCVPPVQRLDLRRQDEVVALVETFQPQLIIHAAAERRPDICENDRDATDALNVSAVTFLAAAAREAGAVLVCLSTDYVFDGTSPPYAVDAKPNPLNYYGESKRAGEIAALESGAEVCVLRVPILYGPVKSLDESAVTIIARFLEQNEETAVDHWAVRYPTHVDDVAVAVRGVADLLEQGERLPEILHFSGNEAYTKFEMANIIAEACGLSSVHLRADSTPAEGAPRPSNCHLDDSLLAKLAPVQKRVFREEIGGLVKPFLK